MLPSARRCLFAPQREVNVKRVRIGAVTPLTRPEAVDLEIVDATDWMGLKRVTT